MGYFTINYDILFYDPYYLLRIASLLKSIEFLAFGPSLSGLGNDKWGLIPFQSKIKFFQVCDWSYSKILVGGIQ